MTQPHPVLACMDAMGAALKDVVDVDPAFMTVEDKRAALVGLASVAARLDELRLRVLADADDVAADDGARDPAAWLAHHTRIDGGAARRQLRLGRALGERRDHLRRALAAGSVNLEQADTILGALDDLPADVGQEVLDLAGTRLVEEASRFAPRQLRVLGRRVLDVVAPEVVEGHEQRLLEREEAHAARSTYLHTRDNGDGTSDLRVRLATSTCRRLLTYLEAFAAPRRSPDDRRPYDERLGAAFGAFLEAVDPARLPLHGGDATTVLVTVDLETLRTGLGTASIGDQPISAGEARRLACQAKIIPAVLDGASQPLDLGRAQRLYQPHQRKAMALTQPTCRATGCTVPATWCEAHHAGVPWGRGGGTDLADGVLLCSFHHHRAHDARYDVSRHPDGSVRFHLRR